MDQTPVGFSEKADSSQQGSYQIIQLPYGLLQSNTYLIRLDQATCLIDPSMTTDHLPDGLPPVRWLVATHGHWDHVAEADAWRALTGAPLLIHAADEVCLTDAQANVSALLGRPGSLKPADQLLLDGQEISLTAAYQLKVLHTPGHTAGSICLLLEHKLADGTKKVCALFSGDTLFAGSVGRTDLGGNDRQLRQSLRRIAGQAGAGFASRNTGQTGAGFANRTADQIRVGSENRIPDDVPIYPGHGPVTTFEQERRTNPWLRTGNS